ncbi:MAG: hypothetical protein CMO40_02585 [Verrucomicrobiaceae bacterium]|nr:hypothetical protein [Verrucomicrobiaceae bacterium]
MAVDLEELRAEAGKVGFREGRDWLFSPEPLRLADSEVAQLRRLGHPLARFQQGCDRIYRRSVKGTLPDWISELLDAGKPAWLVEDQRSEDLREAVPRVIRPDLLLTKEGFSLTELDAVPGGMGITGWLAQCYASAGFEVLGGGEGMLKGFRSLLPNGGEVLISREAADYEPEMQWLLSSLNAGAKEPWGIRSAERYEVQDARGPLYRFFELFDWESIPAARALARRDDVTPPFKPHFEEKLWLALLWSPALRKVWETELRGNHLRRMQELVPHGWVVDPAPLPPHAALPRLEVNDWSQVAGFSQKRRRLVLKISGFSELAWGSRGVIIGHDVSGDEWKRALESACRSFDSQPWIMQEFREARVVNQPYYDPATGSVEVMRGRARLCPYYFLDPEGKPLLGGCLAAIVPEDKKKIHGMRDAILTVCSAEG